MNLHTMIRKVQRIVRDDTFTLPPPPKDDSLEIPDEFRDLVVSIAAAKYMEANK